MPPVKHEPKLNPKINLENDINPRPNPSPNSWDDRSWHSFYQKKAF